MEPTRTPKLAPYLAVRDAAGLVRFIEQGIGGQLTYRETSSEGNVQHAEVRVEDAVVVIGASPPGRPLFPAMLHLYVTDADRGYHRALQAGATSVREPTDAADGDRRGGVRDAWGNAWWFTRARAGH
ncbi:MAG: VOC family protein [Thermoplasmata archaeon]